MRRAIGLAVSIALVAAIGLPATATEAWPGQGIVWGFELEHWNPCTESPSTIAWEAEHRGVWVDADGDESTVEDTRSNKGVVHTLWATHTDDDWVVLKAKDRSLDYGYDPETETPFDTVDKTAYIHYQLALKAMNTETGEWYSLRVDIHLRTNSQGKTIFGEDTAHTVHESGCKTRGIPH